MQFGAVVQRIGHIPSKDTMLVRFQPALPYCYEKDFGGVGRGGLDGNARFDA